MKDSTRIVVLLDRSGSMTSAKESTIAGINKFISEQKSVPGEASLKLVQFDFDSAICYDVTFDKPLSEVELLTQKDFSPRGLTPLLDAQGRTILELGKELSALKESERPNKVIVVTITDGIENCSKDFTSQKIKEMIKHQTDVYNWDFVYLGANQDAIAVGSSLGYMGAKSMTYNISDPLAVGATYSNVSSYVKRARSGPSGQSVMANSFTEEERGTSIKGK